MNSTAKLRKCRVNIKRFVKAEAFNSLIWKALFIGNWMNMCNNKTFYEFVGLKHLPCFTFSWFVLKPILRSNDSYNIFFFTLGCQELRDLIYLLSATHNKHQLFAMQKSNARVTFTLFSVSRPKTLLMLCSVTRQTTKAKTNMFILIKRKCLAKQN